MTKKESEKLECRIENGIIELKADYELYKDLKKEVTNSKIISDKRLMYHLIKDVLDLVTNIRIYNTIKKNDKYFERFLQVKEKMLLLEQTFKTLEIERDFDYLKMILENV